MSKKTDPSVSPNRDSSQRSHPGRRGGPGHANQHRGNQESNTRSEKPDGDLVLVQFKGHRKAYYNNTNKVELQKGDYCIVEADRGRDLGRVCYVGPGQDQWWRDARYQGVLQRAHADQLKRLHENRADEWQDYDICLENIQSRRLVMQLVSVERQFDRNKITFYFTADKRVDFRDLVKDLAGIFRTRIELRQIGVRDEAKMKGGIGLCGRELCCSTFIHSFKPVTLKMAKTQQLPLSPNKLSGICGRLRCCLAYEHDEYARVIKRLPKVGTRVQCAEGTGCIRKINLLQESALVLLDGPGEFVTHPVTKLQWEQRGDLPKPSQGSDRGGCCKNGNN
jgi:cell fate regulator YaaT (PSP1 superfamily)